MLAVRLVGDLFQLFHIRVFDTDGIQDNAIPPQTQSVRIHVILGPAIGDHYGDLWDVLSSSASRCLHKVPLKQEVQAFAGQGASTHVWHCFDVLEDVAFVLEGVELELGLCRGAVLDQADADAVGPNVKTVDQCVEEATDLLKILIADTPRSFNQEDDVSHGLLGAD